jgi:hypothetical protein
MKKTKIHGLPFEIGDKVRISAAGRCVGQTPQEHAQEVYSYAFYGKPVKHPENIIFTIDEIKYDTSFNYNFGIKLKSKLNNRRQKYISTIWVKKVKD